LSGSRLVAAVRRPGTGPVLDRARGGRKRFRVNDEVRRLVTFRPHNLAARPYPPEWLGRMDLILCENVLIYFAPEVMRRVVDELYRCLAPGGYLFLGYSETLWHVSNAFDLMTTPTTFFYQRPLTPKAPPAPPPVQKERESARPLTPTPPRTVLPTRPARITSPQALPVRPSPPPYTPPPAQRERATPHPVPSTDGANVGAVMERNPAGVAAAQEQTRLGRQLLEAGKYGEARQAFESALAGYPAAVEALVGLAQIHAN
jgi:chemotaxis protein methyltransferase CheR